MQEQNTQSAIKCPAGSPYDISTLASRILGDPDLVPLEDRVFSALALLGGSLGIFAMLTNILIGNPMREVAFGAVGGVLGFWFYRVGRRTTHTRILQLFFSLILAVFFVVIWITNEGSHGSTPLFLLVFAGAAPMLVPRRTLPVFWLITMALVISLLAIERAHPEWILSYLSPDHRFMDVSIVLLLVITTMIVQVHLVTQEYRRERHRVDIFRQTAVEERAQLAQALAEISVLKDLLPICASCKRIRDDSGSWHTVEAYITENTGTEFTHSICPSCTDDF